MNFVFINTISQKQHCNSEKHTINFNDKLKDILNVYTLLLIILYFISSNMMLHKNHVLLPVLQMWMSTKLRQTFPFINHCVSLFWWEDQSLMLGKIFLFKILICILQYVLNGENEYSLSKQIVWLTLLICRHILTSSSVE